MLIDSHCHLDRLDLSEREGGLEGVIADAQARGISHLLTVAIDLESSKSLTELTAKYDHIYSSVGVHPLQDEELPLPTVEQITELAKLPKVIAVGETGLDNFYSADSYEWQYESFKRHLLASKQVEKPLIVHTRDARDETIKLLKQHQSNAAGVLHCFTETWDMAKAAMEFGYYISFSGIVTFKNAGELREVVKKIPLDRILVETDSPWLAPVPYRGKQNEPKNVYEVAQCVAELKGISIEELAQVTTHNFFNLFNISK
ncbi:MAG: TatD family hydrolase [Porticoccaceae bacterium]|jgi:TatD DNase family protein